MKLKQKLAKEYACRSSRNEDEYDPYLEGFLAGFEKAREMADKNFKDHYLGLNEEKNLVLWWEFEKDLGSLGEEEV